MGRGGAHPSRPAGVIPPLDNAIWHPGLGEYIWPREYNQQRAMVLCDVVENGLFVQHITIAEEEFVALNSEEERFRSFAERYVIERSVNFRVGYEQEDAWAAMLDAKGIYTQIRGLGAASFGTQQDSNPAQGAPPGAYHSGGGGNPVPRHKSGGLVSTQADVLAALEAAKVAPKKGSLAKLRAAVARVGTGKPKILP